MRQERIASLGVVAAVLFVWGCTRPTALAPSDDGRLATDAGVADALDPSRDTFAGAPQGLGDDASVPQTESVYVTLERDAIYEGGDTQPEFLFVGALEAGQRLQVFSTAGAFAALKEDGSVVAWGNPGVGGDTSPVAASLTGNVSTMVNTYGAFIALTKEGSVVWWGDHDSRSARAALGSEYQRYGQGGAIASGVSRLLATHRTLAATTSDAATLIWPNPPSGSAAPPLPCFWVTGMPSHCGSFFRGHQRAGGQRYFQQLQCHGRAYG